MDSRQKIQIVPNDSGNEMTSTANQNQIIRRWFSPKAEFCRRKDWAMAHAAISATKMPA